MLRFNVGRDFATEPQEAFAEHYDEKQKRYDVKVY